MVGLCVTFPAVGVPHPPGGAALGEGVGQAVWLGDWEGVEVEAALGVEGGEGEKEGEALGGGEAEPPPPAAAALEGDTLREGEGVPVPLVKGEGEAVEEAERVGTREGEAAAVPLLALVLLAPAVALPGAQPVPEAVWEAVWVTEREAVAVPLPAPPLLAEVLGVALEVGARALLLPLAHAESVAEALPPAAEAVAAPGEAECVGEAVSVPLGEPVKAGEGEDVPEAAALGLVPGLSEGRGGPDTVPEALRLGVRVSVPQEQDEAEGLRVRAGVTLTVLLGEELPVALP